MKVYLNNELSNDQYHADTGHINGSGLWNIYDRCPAAWRYKDEEDEQSKALVFGTGSHTALLEPERFEAEYARMPTKEDFGEELLVTASDMNSWAKARGIKGLSGKTKAEVIKIIRSTGEPVRIYDEERLFAELNAKGRILLEGDDYDAIMQMRAVIHANSYYSSLLSGAYSEVSILGQLLGEPSKVRFDCLTRGGDIIDYKTAVSAKPDEFFRHAARLGYFMKMAMQHDMFVEAYGHAPRSVNLLVQEKKSPFIPALIRLTDEQLRIGRIQLRSAMEIYKACKKANSWPGYSMGNPVIEMETPEWFKKQFNL
ncbi:exonuclease VIII [Klebsiella phage VLCpiS13d]|uniref:exonuclease VIII n=1 Tax=Klebsiella phage VLCpiS13d TaxID=2874888 RepID=UPI00233E9D94|nr:exonuclease VIII [Klebsiella phage VLCpiS13d]UVX31725.1 exonuclease VIII [Klebsiella phage VLCpiS13d]